MRVSSASEAIHFAYAVGLVGKGRDFAKMVAMDFRSTRGFKDMDWRHVKKGEAGIILDALAGLEDHLQAWAVWCHGPRAPEYLPEQGRFLNG